jgi:hypothetical protein
MFRQQVSLYVTRRGLKDTIPSTCGRQLRRHDDARAALDFEVFIRQLHQSFKKM